MANDDVRKTLDAGRAKLKNSLNAAGLDTKTVIVTQTGASDGFSTDESKVNLASSYTFNIITDPKTTDEQGTKAAEAINKQFPNAKATWLPGSKMITMNAADFADENNGIPQNMDESLKHLVDIVKSLTQPQQAKATPGVAPSLTQSPESTRWIDPNEPLTPSLVTANAGAGASAGITIRMGADGRAPIMNARGDYVFARLTDEQRMAPYQAQARQNATQQQYPQQQYPQQGGQMNGGYMGQGGGAFRGMGGGSQPTRPPLPGGIGDGGVGGGQPSYGPTGPEDLNFGGFGGGAAPGRGRYNPKGESMVARPGAGVNPFTQGNRNYGGFNGNGPAGFDASGQPIYDDMHPNPAMGAQVNGFGQQGAGFTTFPTNGGMPMPDMTIKRYSDGGGRPQAAPTQNDYKADELRQSLEKYNKSLPPGAKKLSDDEIKNIVVYYGGQKDPTVIEKEISRVNRAAMLNEEDRGLADKKGVTQLHNVQRESMYMHLHLIGTGKAENTDTFQGAGKHHSYVKEFDEARNLEGKLTDPDKKMPPKQVEAMSKAVLQANKAAETRNGSDVRNGVTLSGGEKLNYGSLGKLSAPTGPSVAPQNQEAARGGPSTG